MIEHGDRPGGVRVDYVLRFTMADGSTIELVRDDGSPAWSEDEVREALARVLGTARRAEAARQRRRDIRRRRAG
jgi:hypothetical protein